MKTKTIKTQFGKSAYADFDDYTWTFQMNKPMRVVSGEFAIVDKMVYDELLLNANKLIDACRGNGMSIDGAVDDLVGTFYKTKADFDSSTITKISNIKGKHYDAIEFKIGE